jgi:prepilin-type N-terminal cleavage/methylation domain-containing protein
MKKMNKNKRGFSFIELLAVLTIMAIMTIVASVFMNAGRKSVEVAAREVAVTVREAQNFALTGKNTGKAGEKCTSYTFSWEGGSVNYTIEGTMPADTGCKTQEYSLKNGVQFANGGSFTFAVPFSFVAGSFSEDGYKNIDLQKGNDCFHVKVFSSGIVSEESSEC